MLKVIEDYLNHFEEMSERYKTIEQQVKNFIEKLHNN
jgi:hypothetical protein